jgi:hypothetical protein
VVAVTRALVALLLVACGSDWPAASQRDSLPSSDVDDGPEHRAGQPCTWCHGGPDAIARTMVVGGTIYEHETDSLGASGVQVKITDANGLVFTGTSNRVGNVFLQGGRSREGSITGSGTPVFPLHVEIAENGGTVKMRSQIGREGSCAVCHAEPAGASTVGKIWMVKP